MLNADVILSVLFIFTKPKISTANFLVDFLVRKMHAELLGFYAVMRSVTARAQLRHRLRYSDSGNELRIDCKTNVYTRFETFMHQSFVSKDPPSWMGGYYDFTFQRLV